MEPIWLTARWLPFGIQAVTLWPVVCIQKGQDRKCLRVHELYHWQQALKWGVLPWYSLYIFLWLIYLWQPPAQHPMEREAYRRQRECEQEEKKNGHT